MEKKITTEEKLIELMVEYLIKEGNDVHDLKHINHTFQNKDVLFSDEFICSKRFGFIKWLINNDKIKGFEFYLGDASLEIIQRLSISDNPIQDLISLLK